MELSGVQRNTAKSAELSAAMELFLAKGGSVCNLQGFVHRTKAPAGSYGRNITPKPAEPAPPKKKAHAWNEGVRVDPSAKERVRDLALTMTLAQVRKATGLSTYVLKRIAKQGLFEFQKWNPAVNLLSPKADPVADAFNVVRIKDARDRGISKKAAIKELSISNTLMKRLIRDYAIDYPLQRVRK